MVRLVVTDLDGTVVGKDEILPQEFIHAVKQWKDRGIGYTFATGRVGEQVQDYIEQLDLQLPYIACNGGLIQQGDRVLLRRTMPLGPLKVIFERAHEMGMSLLYSIDSKENAYAQTEYVALQQQAFGRYTTPRMFAKEEWNSLELDKLIIMAKVRDGSLDVIEELCQALPGEYYYKRYANKAIDILPKEASKEKAVAYLAEQLKIPLSQVLTAGDDLNDMEMLREAGVGVAVANALDCVKDVADYVAVHERHLGVIEAVSKFCLLGKNEVAN